VDGKENSSTLWVDKITPTQNNANTKQIATGIDNQFQAIFVKALEEADRMKRANAKIIFY
jgi:hypothetical protein